MTCNYKHGRGLMDARAVLLTGGSSPSSPVDKRQPFRLPFCILNPEQETGSTCESQFLVPLHFD
jgi:hypothetical protein